MSEAQQQRTFERLKYHYEIEKRLAERLRNARQEERRGLYCSVYNEMYKLVPDHPQLVQMESNEGAGKLPGRLRLLKRFLTKDSTFLELGPGDCRLSFALAKLVKKVYAVDITDQIVKRLPCPSNFELLLSDGCRVPVAENSVNVAFSDQVMEHVHPDDALDQLRDIYRSLVPGGIYICLTPNRLQGPHDISAYFDQVATGFHLKEYTNRDLRDLFRKVGFSTVKTFVRAGGRLALLPPVSLVPAMWVESFLERLNYRSRRSIANSSLLTLVLGIRLFAQKTLKN